MSLSPFEKPKYKAEHAGWLLACDAPCNQEKGQRILESLEFKWQKVALLYMEECLESYATCGKE